jgi:hypothetical protein
VLSIGEISPSVTPLIPKMKDSTDKKPWYKRKEVVSIFWPFLIGVVLIIATIILARLIH